MKKMANVPCSIIRGGTTKGIFIEKHHLPADPVARDHAILSLFGSPDNRQINGIGGADPLTSKVVLVNRSHDEETDIEYQSGEVGIDQASINFNPPCGNLATAAALYAFEQGYVEVTEPYTSVRILNRNTGKTMRVEIPVTQGRALVEASEGIDGVLGYGINVELTIDHPSGAISGQLFPAGIEPLTFHHQGRVFQSLILDCGTLYGFFPCGQFGLSGDEKPEMLDLNTAFKADVEALRLAIAQHLSQLSGKDFQSHQIKIALLKNKAFIGSDEVYDGRFVAEAIVVNPYRCHKAYPVSGAVALAALLLLSDSYGFRNQLRLASRLYTIRIVHPTGQMDISIRLKPSDGHLDIDCAAVKRSCRILMSGQGYYVDGDEAH